MTIRMQQGWVCPKCGTVYAPYVERCGNCLPKPVAATTRLGSATRAQSAVDRC
jgi:hypothetical protein